MARAYIKVGLVLVLIAGIVSVAKDALVYRAAEWGYAPAQFHVGFMYEYGQGMPQDDAQAAIWYRRAADQGDVDAQFASGVMYFTGQGGARDIVLAYALFGLAAASGDEQAAYHRDRLFTQMSEAQIAEGEALMELYKSGHALPNASQTGRLGSDGAGSGGAKAETEAKPLRNNPP